MSIIIKKATPEAKFGDLFTDTGTAEWYRLWTGNETGTTGNWVNTSAFNDMGNGWIARKHLGIITPDFAQADDTHLWVQSWSASKGFGEWVTGPVEFTIINQVCITTQVTGDTPLTLMFHDANVGPGTWYQVWVSDQDDPESGFFLDTPEGKGWIRPLEEGGNLSSILFPAAEPGKSRDLWVRTWNKDQQKPNWEYWTVKTLKEAEDKEPGNDDPLRSTAMEEGPPEDDSVDYWMASPRDPALGNLPQLPGKWTDTGPRILVEIGSAEIITGESINSLDFTPIVEGNAGFTRAMKVDTQVHITSDLGLEHGIIWYSGNFDPETSRFVSGDARTSQDLLVVYDTDAGGPGTFYDMIVLTGVADISDANADGIFLLNLG
jgi:hypothetical protein